MAAATAAGGGPHRSRDSLSPVCGIFVGGGGRGGFGFVYIVIHQRMTLYDPHNFEQIVQTFKHFVAVFNNFSKIIFFIYFFYR